MDAASRVTYEPLRTTPVVLVGVFFLVSAWYLSWRPGAFNPRAPVFSAVVFAAELYGFVTVLLHLFMVWRLRSRMALPVPEGLGVDVFVTTINEPLDMVRRTLLAAIRMDYPHVTWLLDDGARPEMAELARELGVNYLSRTDSANAKAGNLNHALVHSRGEFIAVFDADHAPRHDFLTQTLGYFSDPRVAFVQTPQDFYNLDSFQHRCIPRKAFVWTEQSLFFRVIQRGKDYWNAAFFCGSCAVLRRAALDSIGGFATGTVTEDLHTSIRLHKRGYASVYHPQPLAFGVAPATIRPFLRQRIRWGQGAMQVWWKEGVILGCGLTLPQRLNYLASMLTYFDGWQKAVFYVAPAVALATGIMPITAVNVEFLMRFIPYYVLTFWVFEEAGRGYGRSVMIEQYNMARFAAFAWSTISSLLPSPRFRVTDKALTDRRRSMAYTFPQAAAFTLNLGAIPVGIGLYLLGHHLPLGGLAANIVWASLNASIAGATLAFARRRAANRRQDYRFPIPLPYRLLAPGDGEMPGVIDDISSSGCRLYGRFPANIEVGFILELEIFVPGRTLGLRLAVTSIIHGHDPVGQPYLKAIGCRFIPRGRADRDGLDMFLYGSDLQWGVRSLTERLRTPLEWLAELSGRDQLRGDAEAGLHWAHAKVEAVRGMDAFAETGLVQLDGTGRPRRLLAFSAVPDDNGIRISVYTRFTLEAYQAQTRHTGQLDSPFGPVFLYGVREATKVPAWNADCPSPRCVSQSLTSV